ncbi:AraC family transcriptional regulator [Clostridia bacterium OttesenSCG-928-O13]|nr:AraC family transcriptional regulator [Clostridia bacterium OttesenSCG-928-O13]
MNITLQIKAYAEQSGFFGGTLPYEDFISSELGADFFTSTAPRDIDDAVSLLGWVTSEEGLLTLSYATLSGNISLGATLRYPHNTITGLHTHNSIELAYVVKGRLLQKIAGKTEVFHEGEVCLIDRESLHGDCLLHEAATAAFLAIDTTFFNHQLLAGTKSSGVEPSISELIALRKWEYDFVRFRPKQGRTPIARTIELLFEEFLESSPCKTRVVGAYIERLLHLLTHEYQIDLSKKNRGALTDSLFRDIERTVHDHYATVSVKSLAQQYSYSPDYLSRLCSKKTGLTLSLYIQKARMAAAMELLEKTDLSIESVANRVGYQNLGFFYQKFKEHYRLTPNKVRQD